MVGQDDTNEKNCHSSVALIPLICHSQVKGTTFGFFHNAKRSNINVDGETRSHEPVVVHWNSIQCHCTYFFIVFVIAISSNQPRMTTPSYGVVQCSTVISFLDRTIGCCSVSNTVMFDMKHYFQGPEKGGNHQRINRVFPIIARFILMVVYFASAAGVIWLPSPRSCAKRRK
jgi:hypothetical protein